MRLGLGIVRLRGVCGVVVVWLRVGISFADDDRVMTKSKMKREKDQKAIAKLLRRRLDSELSGINCDYRAIVEQAQNNGKHDCKNDTEAAAK
jgi:hypothetical protein